MEGGGEDSYSNRVHYCKHFQGRVTITKRRLDTEQGVLAPPPPPARPWPGQLLPVSELGCDFRLVEGSL